MSVSPSSSPRSAPPSPLRYSPFLPEVMADPYPFYRRLRDEVPAYHLEEYDAWALSRFEDVWDAHLDYETFSSAWGQPLEKTLTPMPLMISMDPPKHTRVRQLVSKVTPPAAWPSSSRSFVADRRSKLRSPYRR